MALNPAMAYKNNSIQTASPADLTLMLYEGAIKFCNIALGALEKGDLIKTNENIIKAERIINEFRATLDFKYPIAKDFDLIYDYIHWVLVKANVKKDPALLTEALNRIREMRDTWKEVMQITKTAAPKR